MTDRLPGIGRALVVGARVTGRAAVDALRGAGIGVVVVDEDPTMLASLPDEVEALAVADARPLLSRVDLVVPSPGVPEVSPLLLAAAEAGVPVWSEPELAGRLHPGRTVLGITGTNGKTTVTELVAAMLESSGVPAVACGNIGTPLVEQAATGDEVLVAELSSFHLRYVDRLRCRVATVLNLAPDHLDWHGGFRPYGAAKARVWAGQADEDWAVTPHGDATTTALLEAAPGRHASFSATGPVPLGVGVVDGVLTAVVPSRTGPVVEIAALPTTAPHHVANVAAAATVALLAGADPDGIAAAARSTAPGAHRVEHVATTPGPVTWVDDSKATNPHAAAAALAAPVPAGRTVWIAGGLAKGVSMAPLAASLVGVRAAVLLGEAAPALAEVCASAGVPTTTVVDDDPMAAAVAAAARVAAPGDRVLLSPACSSFDLFTGYADRGERFVRAARALPGATAPRGAR